MLLDGTQGSDHAALHLDAGCTKLLLHWVLLQDPWCVPARATQIQRYYPAAKRTDIVRQAAHIKPARRHACLTGWQGLMCMASLHG